MSRTHSHGTAQAAALSSVRIPLVIIVSGPPGTGKTTLAKRLAEQFNLPMLTKDDIKETLFNSLGWSDRKWSQKLGSASYDLLYLSIESLLSAGVSHVAESNFKDETATPRFLNLMDKHFFVPFQIQCYADGEVLESRFKARAESGERHPGHVDQENYAELAESLRAGRYDALEIGGFIYELDTTSFDKIDYEALYRAIENAAAAL